MTAPRRVGQPLKFLADHNFNERIVQGVRLANPAIDIITAREIGMERAPDPEVLEQAARNDRLVLSHDTGTMRRDAYSRVASGLPMPGLFLVRQTQPIGPVIAEILLLADSSVEDEWKNRVEYLPLP